MFDCVDLIIDLLKMVLVICFVFCLFYFNFCVVSLFCSYVKLPFDLMFSSFSFGFGYELMIVMFVFEVFVFNKLVK